MESNKSRKKPAHVRKKISPGAGVIFFIVLAAVTVLAWMLPLRPTVSEREKRNLERFPAFSVSSLLDGSYFEHIGLWFSDTFPGRDVWIQLSQGIDSLHGRSSVMIYGTMDAGDAIPVAAEPESVPTPAPAALAESTAAPEATPAVPTATPEPTPEPTPYWGGKVLEDEELITLGAVIQVGDSAYAYTGFSKTYSDIYADAISRAADMLEGKCRVFNVFVLHSTTLMLPREYRESIGCACEEDILEYLNGRLSDKVYNVDTFHSLLPHNSEYIFFHGDHHWTALGAWYVYEEWCKMAGVEPVGLDRYTESVQEPFYGSLYYKANQSNKLTVDKVYAYTPPGDVHLYIHNGDRDTLDKRGYEEELIKQIRSTDKYLCFLTGDLPMCTFVNNDITDGSACMILKNSAGNPFCYYFTQHYQYVYVLDYRKYFMRSLSDFVDYYDVDDVIFCFSAGQAQSAGGSGLINYFVR